MMRERLDFIDLPKRGTKPRRRGLTVVADPGLGLRQVEDWLEPWGEYVDACKFYHLTPALLPAGFTSKKIGLYKKHDIMPMIGGICLELAVCQGRAEQTISWVADAGFEAIEISENFVEFDVKERAELMEKCQKAGLEVFYEYGDKYYDTGHAPSLERVAEVVHAAKGFGASRTIIEESLLDVWLGKDGLSPHWRNLLKLADAVGPDHLVWEAGQPAQNARLVQLFGPEVNLGPNLPLAQVMWLEAGRRGLGRAFGYSWVVDEYARFTRQHGG